MKKTLQQEVKIGANRGKIFNELLLWGEASWWPEEALMSFDNLSGKINEETRYRQRVKLPFAPCWQTRNSVIDRDKFYIKRVFLDGIFEGSEELSVIPGKGDKNKVNYRFNHKIKGAFNKLAWKILFKKLHLKNIDLILRSLKDYLERR